MRCTEGNTNKSSVAGMQGACEWVVKNEAGEENSWIMEELL